jgi:hypothetical protein
VMPPDAPSSRLPLTIQLFAAIVGMTPASRVA